MKAGIRGARNGGRDRSLRAFFSHEPQLRCARSSERLDSAYLVRSITNRMNQWRRNGFPMSTAKKFINSDYFRRLDELVVRLERGGVGVHF
jgi:hypothetical protein